MANQFIYDPMQQQMDPNQAIMDIFQPQQQDSAPVDMSALSGKVQQLLGAKEQTDSGLAQSILSARFNTEPSYGDYSTGVVQSALGKPQLGSDIASTRIGDRLKTIALLERAGSTGNTPSAIQEYEYYNKLPPDRQQTYLDVKRNPQYLNAGDRFVPTSPGRTEIPKGVPPQDDPALKGAQEAEKKKAELITQGQADLPRIVDQGQTAIDQIETALTMPGLDANFGMTGMVPNRPGSEAADAKSFLDQIKSGGFLTAYGQLRGGGSITEVEGEKATTAYARMQAAQSAKAFRQAAKDYVDVIRLGVERARNTASGAIFNNGQPPAGNTPPPSNVIHFNDLPD